ncbi:MAG: DUF1826 domain-containing protein [Pseudomonadota bacterium]
MTIQHGCLTSPLIEIAFADTPLVMLRINAPECAATAWEMQPLASFQTWLDDLNPMVLPQARVMLRSEVVNEATAHFCQQAGMADCPEHGMLAGDIAALAHIFSDIASSEYLRVRLSVFDDHQDVLLQVQEKDKRPVCVYRGQERVIGQVAIAVVPDVSISNCGLCLRWEGRPNKFQRNILCCNAISSPSASQTSLVLTLDPVSTTEETPDLKAETYH